MAEVYRLRADPEHTAPAFTAEQVAALNARFAGRPTAEMLAELLTGELKGRIAVVSSFGAESAVLLDLVAAVDCSVPLIFINTQKMFGETLAYRDGLAESLGFTDLRVYRPDVVLIDLGLPDGRGDALIRDLAQGPRRPSVVMGTSGSAEGRALAAGADGFLDKPLENMAQLCRVLRPLLPELDIHPPPMAPGEPVAPDLLALRDDLAFAQRALQGHPDADRRRYVSAFVAGIARHSQDAAPADAAFYATEEAGLAPLRAALAARLAERADFPSPS